MAALDAETLIFALKPPCRRFVEGEDPAGSASGSKGSIAIRLSTATAYGLPIGDIVANIFEFWTPIRPDQRMAVMTVVHELVMNAVIHGNLGISNSNRTSIEHFAELEKELASRLQAPETAQKTIRIRLRWSDRALYVQITDQGRGFMADRPDDPSLPYGRGRKIVAALSSKCRWTDGGRSVSVRFER
jgi:hypothetical protein